MAGVSVKMGVTGVSTFKRSIGDAESAVKALDAALKLNESQMKLNGNQETYLSNKTKILKDRIAAQTKVVQEAEKALKAMKDKGVSPTSKEFQNMQTKVYNAATKLTNMKTELKNVETNSGKAATGLNKTNESLKSLNKAKAWDNVSEGIGKVTKTLEQGARAAINFGNRLMGAVKDSTGWADDLLTLSMQTDIDVETLQKMQHLAEIVDTDVDAIINAKKRMTKAAAGEGAKDIQEMFGIEVTGKNPDDLFWDLGEAILGMGDAFDKESAAQKVFGRNWNELLPLFKMGRTEYEKMLSEQAYLTEEQVQNLGNADDKIKEFEQQIAQLKNEFWSENADKITGLLQWLIDKKDRVYSALKVIGAGFGLLKLGEFALHLGKAINGFKELGLIKGAEAAAGSAAGAGTAGTATGLGMSGLLGIGGSVAIVKGFQWAANQRLYHRDQVRGTDEYLAAQSNGVEQMLADWILAERAMSEALMNIDTTEQEAQELQTRLEQTRAALESAEGGWDAIQAYKDWRQERSLGDMDWEMPENIDKMTRTVEESFSGQAQSNSEMTAAANDLKGLPAAVSAAVRSGMSGVTIIINDSAVSAIGRKVGSSMARGVQALLN